jgi:hypothetical protein
VINDIILFYVILHCLLFFDVTCSMSSWMLPMYGPDECNKRKLQKKLYVLPVDETVGHMWHPHGVL